MNDSKPFKNHYTGGKISRHCLFIVFALIKKHSYPNILEMVQLAPPPPHLHPFVSPILERMILRYKIYDRRR